MYIILGKNGYIAEAMIKELKSRNLPHVAWSRADVDYTNLTELKYNLYILGDDLHVINCAGYIGKPNVDACELAKADCIEGNVLLPAMLAQLCNEIKYDFTQISSGCIYGGYEKDFTEDDAPNFDFQNGSFYSGTKALAEKVVLQNNPNSYVFRLRIPFDKYESPRNYLTKLLSYDTLLDAKNSLSHRGDFAKYSIDLIEQGAPKGIYNIANKGSITTKHVTELFKLHKLSNKEFIFFTNLDAFMSAITAPRSNCVLDTSKIEQYINIRTAEEALTDSILNYTYK
jgi:dTDP-4-dehydrorhamnose reductase